MTSKPSPQSYPLDLNHLNSDEFARYLVELVLGISYSDLPQTKKDGITEEILDIYFTFIGEYFSHIAPNKSKIQFSVMLKQQSPEILQRLDSLQEELYNAHQLFTQTILN